MCIRKLSCFDYLFFGGTGLSVAYVFQNRSGKKIDVLLYDSNVVSKALELDVTDVFSVDLNIAFGYIVKSRN